MENKSKINTVRQLLYLLLICVLLGIIKVEFFLTFIDNELVDIARVISYVTLGISSVFFYFVIVLAIYSSHVTIELIKLGTHFKINNFYKSINYFIWSLMINELSKFLITIFTFENIGNITSENEFKDKIVNNTLWLGLINISDIFFIVMGSLVYAFVLEEKEKDVKYAESLISIIPLLISFVIFRFVT